MYAISDYVNGLKSSQECFYTFFYLFTMSKIVSNVRNVSPKQNHPHPHMELQVKLVLGILID